MSEDGDDLADDGGGGSGGGGGSSSMLMESPTTWNAPKPLFPRRDKPRALPPRRPGAAGGDSVSIVLRHLAFDRRETVLRWRRGADGVCSMVGIEQLDFDPSAPSVPRELRATRTMTRSRTTDILQRVQHGRKKMRGESLSEASSNAAAAGADEYAYDFVADEKDVAEAGEDSADDPIRNDKDLYPNVKEEQGQEEEEEEEDVEEDEEEGEDEDEDEEEEEDEDNGADYEGDSNGDDDDGGGDDDGDGSGAGEPTVDD